MLMLVVLLISHVHAHTYLSSVTIDGQKENKCVRPVENNSPIMPLTTNPVSNNIYIQIKIKIKI